MADPRALVVDDDTTILRMVERLLHRAQIEVDCARDGDEAIEFCRQRDYDVVILDMMMPRVNGFEVLDALRSERPHLVGRTVVMTAFVKIERDQVADVYTVLPKPFDIHTLVATVLACLEGRPPR